LRVSKDWEKQLARIKESSESLWDWDKFLTKKPQQMIYSQWIDSGTTAGNTYDSSHSDWFSYALKNNLITFGRY